MNANDWHTALGVLATIIYLSIIYPYVRSILKGPTRPNIVSWAGWCFLFAIASGAQFSKGASWSLVVPLFSTLSTAIIAFVAIREGYARLTRVDVVCLALGVSALVVWGFTHEPLTALVLIILADLFVTIPTIVKTYRVPETEPAGLWALYVFASGLAVVATTTFTIYNLLYPLYTVVGSSVIALLALRRAPHEERI